MGGRSSRGALAPPKPSPLLTMGEHRWETWVPTTEPTACKAREESSRGPGTTPGRGRSTPVPGALEPTVPRDYDAPAPRNPVRGGDGVRIPTHAAVIPGTSTPRRVPGAKPRTGEGRTSERIARQGQVNHRQLQNGPRVVEEVRSAHGTSGRVSELPTLQPGRAQTGGKRWSPIPSVYSRKSRHRATAATERAQPTGVH